MAANADYDKMVAYSDEEGIVEGMDVACFVVYGACLHGMGLQALGPVVLFVEGCDTCEALLKAEGFIVQHSTACALAA